MTLHRLVYTSRNRVGRANPFEGVAADRMPPRAMEAEINQILAASRRNNAAIGITGALTFNAGCFAQVLEGEQEPLETTFERIQQDERHGDVSLLAFDVASERAFGGWSMGFVGASRPDGERFAGVAAESGFDPSFLTGEAVFRILHELALQEEAAA